MTEALLIDALRSPLIPVDERVGLSVLDGFGLLDEAISTMRERHGLAPEAANEVRVAYADCLGTEQLTDVAQAAERSPTVLLREGQASCGDLLAEAARRLSTTDSDYIVVAVLGIGRASQEAGTRDVPEPADPATVPSSPCDLDRHEVRSYVRRSHLRAQECLRAGDFVAESLPLAGEHRESSVVTSGHPYSACVVVLLVATPTGAVADGRTPRARVLAHSAVGRSTSRFDELVTATRQVLAAGGLTTNQIDHAEIAEEPATLPVGWIAAFGIDPALVNPRGGSLGLARAPGVEDLRMFCRMLNALEATGGRIGIQAMSAPRGGASVTAIERVTSARLPYPIRCANGVST